MAELPVLYSFRRCPYAMRARMALQISGQRVVLHEVALRDKPQALRDVSPKATVPVLVLPDGRVLEQSLDIMLWALAQADPAGWLSPDRGAMVALIAENDGPFKTHLDRYKYGTRYPGVDAAEHRTAGVALLQTWNARLGDAGFFGPRRCLADFAIAPFVRQFANTDRQFFDALPLPNLQRWLDEILSSGLFAAIMHKTLAPPFVQSPSA